MECYLFLLRPSVQAVLLLALSCIAVELPDPILPEEICGGTAKCTQAENRSFFVDFPLSPTTSVDPRPSPETTRASLQLPST